MHSRPALVGAAAILLTSAPIALAADPTTAPSGLHDVLISTNARVGEELVWWGLRLLVVCFVGLAIAAVIAWIRTLTPTAGGQGLAAGGLGSVLETIVRAIPDLIRTPAGIGALIIVLGVVMLLATAAIDSNS